MVELMDECGGDGFDGDALVRDAEKLLASLGFAHAELSIVMCDDAFISALNFEWRGIEAATDVLSFPQHDAVSPGVFDVAVETLGDVVVSTQTAARQGAELGHGLEVELRALVVHGLLHLLGHDHETDDDAARMSAAERALLGALGLEPPVALVARGSGAGASPG